MAHEIEKTDVVGIVNGVGWHALGTPIEEGLSAVEAMASTTRGDQSLDFQVTQEEVYRKHWDALADDWQFVKCKNNVSNVRIDTNEEMGIVGADFCVFQQSELAEFADALSDSGTVKVDTLGSIKGGRRVWISVRGDSISVQGHELDELQTYLCWSNGHDGGACLRGTPTTVRSVCSNTLHAVIPRFATGSLGSAAFVIKHTKRLRDRVQQAREALTVYSSAIESTQYVINTLAGKSVSSSEVKQFFMEVYQDTIKEIPITTADKKYARARERAKSANKLFDRRFDDEVELGGANYWTAFNAFSGLIQHDMKARGSDDESRIIGRINSNLFGLNSKRTQRAFELAYQLSV